MNRPIQVTGINDQDASGNWHNAFTRTWYGPGNTLASVSSFQTVVRDPAVFFKRSATDAFGRLIEVQENPTSGPGSPSGNGAATYTTTYTYDVLDDLTGVTQPGLSNSACSNGQSRCFTYDSLKRLVQANNPESGSITYQYDSSGNLSKRIDPVRTVSFAAYDGLNRINGKSYSDTNPNTPAVTYTYCDTTGTCASSCNGLGRLSSVSTNAASGTTSNGMSWSAPAITDTYS